MNRDDAKPPKVIKWRVRTVLVGLAVGVETLPYTWNISGPIIHRHGQRYWAEYGSDGVPFIDLDKPIPEFIPWQSSLADA